MNKKIIAVIAVVAVLILGTGGVYATGQIARSNAISETDAINFALVDAGVQPDDAVVTQVEFDYEKGTFVYEIEFYANGVEYDYTIDSTNGKILERSVDRDTGIFFDNPGNNDKPVESDAKDKDDKSAADAAVQTISLDDAKAIALKEAGVSQDQVIYEKAKLERDDGRLVYDIEFYIEGQMEYDFEIDANTGTVIEQSYETVPATNGTKAEAGGSNGAATGSAAGAGSGTQAASSGSSGNSGGSGGSSSSGGSGTQAASSGGLGSASAAGSGSGAQAQSAPAASAPAAAPSQAAAAPAPSTQAAPAASNTIVSGDDIYKEENGQVYEWDDDDGWELEKDKKIVNGKVYEWDDDDGWELEDDDDDDD